MFENSTMTCFSSKIVLILLTFNFFQSTQANYNFQNFSDLFFKKNKFQSYVDLILDRFVQVSGDRQNFLDYSELKVRKINKTMKLVGKTHYRVPLDNNIKLSTLLYINQGGEYRLTPYHLPKQGFCTLINTDQFFMKDLADNSEFPYPYPCPFPNVSKICLIRFNFNSYFFNIVKKGTYEVFGFAPKFSEDFVMIQEGKYAVEVRLADNSKVLAVVRAYVTMIKF